MAMRIRRSIEIMLSNYVCISGACAATYEGTIGYATDNMKITEDEIGQIARAWNGQLQSLTIRYMPLLVALVDSHGLVAINPDGATSLVMGTGKGVWYVCAFIPMDQDKSSIMRECIQVAKNLEASVSIFDI
jgi:hypothetical protein